MDEEKVYRMPFAQVYTLLCNKAVRKGRTQDEVDAVICWLTGYDRADLQRAAAQGVTYGHFFRHAPQMNEKRSLICGKVCGVRVEDVPQPLMRDIRRLDKLVDELAKGRPLEKVLRD